MNPYDDPPAVVSASGGADVKPDRPDSNSMYKLEGVTVCVGYADFLSHTLPLNKPLFDRFVVVTAPWDEATRRVCDHNRVRYVETNEVMRSHDEFRKGVGINRGLKDLAKDGWMVHMDADIALPTHTREILENADLDTSMVYGIDRAEFKNYGDWRRFQDMPEPQVQGNGVFIHTTHTGQTLGTRVMFSSRGGWLPIGFFQLWHADSKILTYPEGHTSAGREDSLFGALWPRKKRSLIPEIIAYHLESENAPMSVNWKGRKSKPFNVDCV